MYGELEFKPHGRVSLGHGPNQQWRAVPRQGSWGQVPTQHQHVAPLHRWTVDAGPKAIEEDLHRPGTVRPSPRGSGEELEQGRLHEGSVHRKRRTSENNFVLKTICFRFAILAEALWAHGP